MRKFKRLTMTLALLITAVGGAWAQSSLNAVELEMPAAWQNDNSNVTAGDLTGFSASSLAEAQAWTGAPAPGNSILIYAFDGDNVCFVQFINGDPSEGRKSSWSKSFLFSIKSDIKFFITTELTEWSLTPDADKKVWTLDKMPANDVELQVEYFAESNLFLSEEALADKTSIAVKAGELGVQFGEDGKSANTITEGTAMTVKYNGSKKILGMKAEKKAISMLSDATAEDVGKVVCAAGHLHDAKTAVPSGCTAVGILGKVTETGHGLILALNNASSQTWNTINGWTSVTTYAGTTLKQLPDDAARGANLTSYTTLGSTTVSNWCVAQKSDYEAIFTNLGSTAGNDGGRGYDANVNAYITTGVGGTAMSSYYWSASEDEDGWGWLFWDPYWNGGVKGNSQSLRPVLGF